jgi:ABC-type sugar transport system permease subunit
MSKKRIGLTHQRAVTGYLFILPFIIGFILFMIQPLYQSLQMSLSDVALNSGKHGFGLTWNNYYNYIKAFTIDPEFNRMLATQIETMIVQSIATIVFSFFVALILNQQFKGRALVRSIFFLAVILSSGVLVGIEYNNSLLAGLKKTIEEEGNANSVTSVLEKILTSGTINASSKKIFDTLFEIIDKIYDVAMASGIQIIIFLSGL